MKPIEVKRTYCSKYRRITTCHVKNGRYYCPTCYINVNAVMAPVMHAQ